MLLGMVNQSGTGWCACVNTFQSFKRNTIIKQRPVISTLRTVTVTFSGTYVTTVMTWDNLTFSLSTNVSQKILSPAPTFSQLAASIPLYNMIQTLCLPSLPALPDS